MAGCCMTTGLNTGVAEAGGIVTGIGTVVFCTLTIVAPGAGKSTGWAAVFGAGGISGTCVAPSELGILVIGAVDIGADCTGNTVVIAPESNR